MYDGWRKWQGFCFYCIACWTMHYFLMLSVALSNVIKWIDYPPRILQDLDEALA